ncbi:MAG: hypothetical protein WCF25_13310, partial [Acidimicrobiales bacterium]
MDDRSLGSSGDVPIEKQRQLYFLGMGLFSATFVINVIFFFAYEWSSPHLEAVRILAPLITVVFTVMDTMFLRSLCRKQFSDHPEVLSRWPIVLSEYSIWPY